jgi:archaellum component FlaC
MIKTLPATLIVAFIISLSLISSQAIANGEITDQVNHLQDHISEYTEEVHWLNKNFNSVVDAYEKQGKDATDTDQLIDFWEEVDFHAAIETQFVPIYANIWQGIYGIKQGIENGESIDKVRKEQDKLNQALWQALGAVKLAAQYQQRGLISKIHTTEVEPTSPPEIIEDIKTRLDQVVAKYAEQLNEVAVTLVHDTYLQRFEGIEGALIEQDADLVEDLEKDFNVTLPQAIENKKSVDQVRQVVASMKEKLNHAKQLLVDAEADRKPVF